VRAKIKTVRTADFGRFFDFWGGAVSKVFWGVGLLATLIFFLALVITKDPKISSVGKPQKIECYSGGQLVFSDELSSVLDSYDTHGIYYRSAITGKYVQVFMDCLVVEK
jgi:hypothetical protein